MTYYFRSNPRTQTIPEGYSGKKVYKESVWDCRFQCVIHGHVGYPRPLSQDEQQEHGLIPDPRNYLAAVRKG